MSAGTSEQSSKPTFLDGQKELATEALFRIVSPRAFGGAPDAGTEVNQQRQEQQLTRSFAERGLTGSGLETKSLRDFSLQAQQQRDQGMLQAVERLFTPLGQQSSGSSIQAGLS